MEKAQQKRSSIFLNPAFIKVFFSQASVYLGDQFLVVILSWTVVQEIGGAELGLVLAAWALPRGILLFFGGAFVDRADRRTVGILTACGVSFVTFLAGIAVFNNFYSLSFWVAVAICLGILDALRLPIGGSLVPLLLPKKEIVNANRWIQLLEFGSMSGGPAIAGVTLALWGSVVSFMVICGLYLFGGIFFFLLPSLPSTVQKEENILHDLGMGLKWVFQEKRLRVLLPTFALANLFILGLYSVGIVVFSKTVLDAGAQGLGYLSASFGIGLAMGTVLMPLLPKWMERSLPALFFLFLLSDLALAFVGVSGNLIFACGLYFMSGLFAGPAATLYRSSLQMITPEHMLGRVNGIARAMSFGLEPVSTSLIGALSSVISAGLLILFGGFAAAVADSFGIFAGGLVEKKHQQNTSKNTPTNIDSV